MVSGSRGGAPAEAGSQFAESQLRTTCLSKLAVRSPCDQASASQYRLLSLVSTSSASMMVPSALDPNSNLVSAMMRPRSSAIAAARV